MNGYYVPQQDDATEADAAEQDLHLEPEHELNFDDMVPTDYRFTDTLTLA